MQPFITGSHAYGVPTEESDIDLVLPPTDQHVIHLLMENSDEGMFPIRYGKLNFIITNSPDVYNLWKACTKYLITQAPISREGAIAYIQGEFEKHGLIEHLQTPSG